jgi:MFS family permease
MYRDATSIRENLKSPRAAAIAGVIFSTLFILLHVLIRKSIPANPFGSATEFIRESKTLSLVFGLVPFGGIAFLWFIAVIRDRLGDREDRFFATVFLGSGLVYLALMFVCAAIGEALLEVLGAEPEKVIQSGAYAIGRASIYEILHVYAIRMAAVFMISVSTIMLRTHIGPRWLTLLGYVLALILLFGAKTFEWAALVFPLWALLISVLILVQRFRGYSHAGRESAATVR